MKSILKIFKTLSVGLFVLLFLAAMSMTACTAKTGAEAGDDPPVEEAAESDEHPSDSEEHPSDDAGEEHPSDSTEGEHPSDSDSEHPEEEEES